MFTKAEKDNFVRNFVMEVLLEDKVDFDKIDNNSVLFEVRGLDGKDEFVEVKFIVKGKTFDKERAIEEYANKVAAAAKRLADSEKNVAKK